MNAIKCFNQDCHYWDDGEVDNCSKPLVTEIKKCFDAIIDKDSPVKSKNFYYEELKSNQCWCDEPKKPGHSFCFTCYRKLPKELRSGLWKKIGHGYEAAYEEAVRFLGND